MTDLTNRSETQTESAPPELIVPDDVKKNIRNGGHVGLFMTLLALSAILAVMYGPDAFAGPYIRRGFGPSPEAFIEIFLIASLTIGVYLKSRAAAVSLLLYYSFKQITRIVSGIMAGTFTWSWTSWFIIVFVLYLLLAVIGTWEYHELVKEHQDALKQYSEKHPQSI